MATGSRKSTGTGSGSGRSGSTRNTKTRTSSHKTGQTKKTAASRRASASEKTRGYKNREQEQEEEIIRRDVVIILLFALTVFIFLANFGIFGPFGNFFRDVFFGLFGLPAYILPLFVFGAALFYTANAENPVVIQKIAAATGILFGIGIICELACGDLADMNKYSAGRLYELCSEERHGGGVIAGSIAYMLQHFLKMPGTVLVLLVLFVICGVMISRKSLIGLLEGTARTARERHEIRRTEREERRAEWERYVREHPEEFEEPEEEEDYEDSYEDARAKAPFGFGRLNGKTAPKNTGAKEVEYRGIIGDTTMYAPSGEEDTAAPAAAPSRSERPAFNAVPPGERPRRPSRPGSVRLDSELSKEELEERLQARAAFMEQDALYAEFEKRRRARLHRNEESADAEEQSVSPAAGSSSGISSGTASGKASAASGRISAASASAPSAPAASAPAVSLPASSAEMEKDLRTVSVQETPVREVRRRTETENLHEIHAADFASEEDLFPEFAPAEEGIIQNTAPADTPKDYTPDYTSDAFADMVIEQGIGDIAPAVSAAELARKAFANKTAPAAAAGATARMIDDLHTLEEMNSGRETGNAAPSMSELYPDETYRDEVMPDEVLPDQKLPDEVLPDEKLPDETLPDEKLPDEVLPDEKLPDEKLPDEKLHDEILPDEKLPDEIIPDPVLPDEVIPEEKFSDEVPSDEVFPDEPAASSAAADTVDVEIVREKQEGPLTTVTEEGKDLLESSGEHDAYAPSKDVRPAAVMPAPPRPEKRPYVYPPLSLLKEGSHSSHSGSDEELRETAATLQNTLKTFGVNIRITNISQGPAVTRYEMQPEQGVKVSRIVNLSDDIKLALAATDIRIEAPIPGKSAIGIEVPNKITSMVALHDILDTEAFRSHKSKLAFAVGKDIAGQAVVTDIAKMPHVLIAGATGSGKSVCINTIIMSILYHASPEDVRLIMIDPKVVELSVYNGIPHLMIPVVTDPQKAAAALNWAVQEMLNRFEKFAQAHVRDLKGYNALVKSKLDAGEETDMKMIPQLVVIVDELADLMMVAKSDVETAICRLAQLARAAGIHLIIATQRPSVDVITGLIKANMPSRIAFAVTSGTDSRTILDRVGAEKLLGKGDMLFFPQSLPKPSRIQGAFVSDEEVSAVVDFLIANNPVGNDTNEVQKKIDSLAGGGTGEADDLSGQGQGSDIDELFADAGSFIIEKNSASIGLLQRRFRIGFNRAARIMDQLCDAGVVGEAEGTKSRRILMTPLEFEQYVEENL